MPTQNLGRRSDGRNQDRSSDGRANCRRAERPASADPKRRGVRRLNGGASEDSKNGQYVEERRWWRPNLL